MLFELKIINNLKEENFDLKCQLFLKEEERTTNFQKNCKTEDNESFLR